MKELNVMGIVRTMDDLGRVVIPKEIRRSMGINEGDSVDILASAEGSIILRKAVNGVPTCPCPCNNTEENKRIHTFVSEYTDDVKVIKISEEQEKLLEYLLDNDLISCDYSHDIGCPNAVDLT